MLLITSEFGTSLQISLTMHILNDMEIFLVFGKYLSMQCEFVTLMKRMFFFSSSKVKLDDMKWEQCNWSKLMLYYWLGFFFGINLISLNNLSETFYSVSFCCFCCLLKDHEIMQSQIKNNKKKRLWIIWSNLRL